MIKCFLLILSTIHFSVFADQNQLSVSLLNSELKKNYTFVERSLNQSAMKIENSSGKILFDDVGITVNVLLYCQR